MLLAAAVGQLENDSPGGAKVRDSDTGEKPKDPDAMKPGGGAVGRKGDRRGQGL